MLPWSAASSTWPGRKIPVLFICNGTLLYSFNKSSGLRAGPYFLAIYEPISLFWIRILILRIRIRVRMKFHLDPDPKAKKLNKKHFTTIPVNFSHTFWQISLNFRNNKIVIFLQKNFLPVLLLFPLSFRYRNRFFCFFHLLITDPHSRCGSGSRRSPRKIFPTFVFVQIFCQILSWPCVQCIVGHNFR